MSGSTEKIYVCGLEHRDRPDLPWRLHLVRPSHTDEPYVAQGIERAKRLHWLCEHHSHLYEVSNDGHSLSLVQRGAPSLYLRKWTLTTQQARDINTVVIGGRFWMNGEITKE